MEDIFIKKIEVKKARNVIDFTIPIDNESRKNLIITGKNGSGKTSLLNEIKKYLDQVQNGNIDIRESYENTLIGYQRRKSVLEETPSQNESDLHNIEREIQHIETFLKSFGGTNIELNKVSLTTQYFKTGNFIIAFFDAKRNTEIKTPTGINKVEIKPVYGIYESAGNEFIQYIVNLKADRSFAKDDNDYNTIDKIDEWFSVFEKNLFSLFDSKDISLKFDRRSYNFNIIEEGKEPYNLNQLSGGYSAILSIVTELIMRMEIHKTKSYDVQGVVLIDEIETHLHIELQKRILPFLTTFFPRIQFIVTTHSPFVLSSIKNTVICDLEKRIVTTDLSGYSYDTLIESYFGSDKYSLILHEYVNEYECLMEKDELNEGEEERLNYLKRYFNEIPKFMSDELVVKIQQIKLKELSKRAKR